ncbi:MAG TPA: hypothetical protein VG942_01065, partial [Hyphomonadaceae bacterium]|nr:hypothetical protein [Hyphomonadaceae bacterium]
GFEETVDPRSLLQARRQVMENGFWTSDFVFENGVVLVKKTGHRVQLSAKLWQDVAVWLAFYLRTELWRLQRRLTGRRRTRIAFVSDRPRPWYLIWAVMAAMGARVVRDPSKADVVMQFDDSTFSPKPSLPEFAGRAPRLVNLNCQDVSKSAVARAFERAAGYSLAVDPAVYPGAMVDKSEVNAAHDGRIIVGPFPAEPGRCYQKVIDNEVEGGLVEDLRTVTVGGRPVVVFRKRRPLSRRFANENAEVDWVKPDQVYSPEEIALIGRFARELKLDWGGIDVLRHRGDGRIYIVDANKTDMGPPIALPLREKLRATHRIARAFSETFAG